ncbi:MAG: hypothetical protein GXY03_03835 [Solirubrobacterales bacterium]|nr:hypothetical protein [Solirubrobacterales bacterium]
MKDRAWIVELDQDSYILFSRSSTHPIIYAITLVTTRRGRAHAVRTYDNAHRADEHHVHRYIGQRKQPPTMTHGPVNEAMARADRDIRGNWRSYIRQWEETIDR